MDIVLLVLSSALSLALVSFGLTLIERCIGVIPLEILPLGIAIALEGLSICSTSSPYTLAASNLVLPSLACLALLYMLHPVYVQWRRRLGGESRALMFSFTLMSCWIQLMQIRTDSKAFSLDLPDALRADQSRALKCLVSLVSITLLLAIGWLVNRKGKLAAVQLSRSDSRLLQSFGYSSLTCQRLVLGIALLLIVSGVGLYIALQDNFSVQSSYNIVIPAFAISLSQVRIRVVYTIIVSIVLLTGIEWLTSISSAETVRESHQSVMYGFVVLIALSFRLARTSGWVGIVVRKGQGGFMLLQQVRHG